MRPEWILVLQLFCAVCGIAGLIVSCVCLAMVCGFTRSTHTVQYQPLDEVIPDFKTKMELIDKENEELMAKVGRKKKAAPIDLEQAVEEVSSSEINFS